MNFLVQIFPFFKILEMRSKDRRSIGMTVLKNIQASIGLGSERRKITISIL